MIQKIKIMNKGFSVLELLVVCVILAIIAGFAIPAYDKSVTASHMKDMRAQLVAIHGANLQYRTHNGTYLNTSGTALTDRETLAQTLGISLMANNGTTFSYNSADGSNYTATSTWKGNTLTLTDGLVTATNPG